jgi:hypothetical protein
LHSRNLQRSECHWGTPSGTFYILVKIWWMKYVNTLTADVSHD